MRTFLRTTTAVLLVAGSLVLAAGPVSAGHVACGDTITADTTLDEDLVDCPGVGLFIVAPNITLDLNGHTIDGPAGLVRTGIANAGYDGVTVKNGVIREFSHSVFLYRARSNVLTGLHVTGGGDVGILLSASDSNVVSGNVIEGQLLNGIELLGDGDFNTVSANQVTRNRGTGIEVRGIGNQVSGNQASDNGQIGIRVTAEASETVVEGNLAHDNGWSGSTRFDGILVESSTTKLRNNVANNNGDYGIEAVSRLKGAVHNVASGNGNTEQCLNVNCR